jgi:hypothetical protein
MAVCPVASLSSTITGHKHHPQLLVFAWQWQWRFVHCGKTCLKQLAIDMLTNSDEKQRQKKGTT